MSSMVVAGGKKLSVFSHILLRHLPVGDLLMDIRVALA